MFADEGGCLAITLPQFLFSKCDKFQSSKMKQFAIMSGTTAAPYRWACVDDGR